MAKFFTLESAEKYFNLKSIHNRCIDKCLEKIHEGFQVDFYTNLKEHTEYLLSDKVTQIDRIIEILRHLNCKGKIISYTLIKNETDVIIFYEDKEEVRYQNLDMYGPI